MMSIEEKAYAKINLILDVSGKRPDGYHDIRTVFQSLRLADTVTLSAAASRQLTLSCNMADVPLDAGNLAWQAATLLRETYRTEQGVHISLTKKIPVAGGLAGGSSNAAAVLRGLVRLWGLPREPDVLHRLAARLGSDVPFCLQGGTALGTGRGEELTPLPPCPHFHVVLANPGFPVSTARVYRHLAQAVPDEQPDVEGLVQAVEKGDQAGIAGRLANVLESPAFALYPEVQALKSKMAQAGPSLLCGSGATVFAIFGDAGPAGALYRRLQSEGTACWLTETYNPAEEEMPNV